MQNRLFASAAYLRAAHRGLAYPPRAGIPHPLLAATPYRSYNKKTQVEKRLRSRSPGRQTLSAGSPNPLHNTLRKVKQNLRAAQEAQASQQAAPWDATQAFKHDSTLTLCKKFIIYKVMGSNMFINYSLAGMNFAYKLFGVKVTNTVIEQTAGSIFTGGVDLKDLSRDIEQLEERGVGGIGCYVVEGVRNIENKVLDQFLDLSLEAVDVLTKNGK